jgi:hypothetical protein
VDPVQTHYFSENLVVQGIELGTTGSVARNSDHYTTEAVHRSEYNIKIDLSTRIYTRCPRREAKYSGRS